MVDGVLAALAAIFPYGLLHAGGDEVQRQCWDADGPSRAWMAERGLDAAGTFRRFTSKAAASARAAGRRAVQWNDVHEVGAAADARSVVQVWKRERAAVGRRTIAETIARAADAGHDVIASPQHATYLSLVDTPPSRAYDFEPCVDLGDASCGRVLGVEAAVWAGQESETPNFKGSYLGRFPLVSADLWTSDHLSERSRSVDAFSGTRARGTLTLKRR